MKELYGEGPASHTDPESCVVSRKAGHEALTAPTGPARSKTYVRLGWPMCCSPQLRGRSAVSELLNGKTS